MYINKFIDVGKPIIWKPRDLNEQKTVVASWGDVTIAKSVENLSSF